MTWIIRQRTFSKFAEDRKQEEWLMCQVVVPHHSEGPWQIGYMGWWGFVEVQQWEMQSSTMGKRSITPCLSRGWQLPGWRAALQKRSLGLWWPQGSNVTLQHRGPAVSWAALGRTFPVGQGRWSLPSTQYWGDHFWSSIPSSELRSTGQTCTLQS